MGLPNWLCALDFHLSLPKEMVILGSLNDPRTVAILNMIHKHFVPNKIVVGDSHGFNFPLLKDRKILNESPSAFICLNYSCQLPSNDPNGN
jgi:hypothetical protein